MPPVEEAALAVPACDGHAANPSVARCVRCDRPVCHVCVFTFGADTYCPECLTTGASGEEASGATRYGALSMVLAVIGAAMTVVFVLGAPSKGTAMALSYPWLGATIGGAALALVARDGGRRRGSLLPIVGLAANGILIAIQLALTVIGSFS